MGCGFHEAMELSRKMESEGFELNSPTFVALILASEGLFTSFFYFIFSSIKTDENPRLIMGKPNRPVQVLQRAAWHWCAQPINRCLKCSKSRHFICIWAGSHLDLRHHRGLFLGLVLWLTQLKLPSFLAMDAWVQI